MSSPYRIAATGILALLASLFIARSPATAQSFPPPSDLTATALYATAVQLNWTDTTGGAAGFVVERSSDPAVNFVEIVWDLPAGATGYLDHGLDTDTTYHYRVRIQGEESSGQYSNVVPVAVVASLPPAPFVLAASTAPLGALATGTSTVSFDGVYRFAYEQGGEVKVRYEIDLADIDVQKGLLRIAETVHGFYPVSLGGTLYRDTTGAVWWPWNFVYQTAAVISMSHQLFPSGILRLHYTETLNGNTTEKRFEIVLVGRTLVIRAYAVGGASGSKGNYMGFMLQQADQVIDPVPVEIPYMYMTPLTRTGSGVYYATALDWLRSHSNQRPQRIWPANPWGNAYENSYYSRYIPGRNDVYPVLHELAYVTVSDSIEDCFMGIHRPPSAYRSDLSDRVVIDLQVITGGEDPVVGVYYPNTLAFLDDYHAWRMDRLTILLHSSCYLSSEGIAFPTYYPPSEWYGTLAQLAAIARKADDYGYLFAPLQQDSIDFFDNSPYWAGFCDSEQNPLVFGDSMPVALGPDGKCQLSGWYSPDYQPGHFYYYLAQDRMLDYARLQAPDVEAEVNPSAVYLDVSPKLGFEDVVDYSDDNPRSRTLEDGLRHARRFNDYMRETHGGPVFGEGGGHIAELIDTHLAGNLDGVEREILRGESEPVIPDFELRVVKPLMANQGVGYIDRWLDQPAAPIVLRQFDFDKYRATALAFGHTGFASDIFLFDSQAVGSLADFRWYWIKEFHSFRAVQEEYLSAAITEILYRDSGGQLVNLDGALADGVDFVDARLKIRYENGLELYVNRHRSETWEVTVAGDSLYLPPAGWAAHNPTSGLRFYSHLVDAAGNPSPAGQRVDYLWSADYIFVDGRGAEPLIPFGLDYYSQPIRASRILVLRPDGFRLTELADGSFEVTEQAPLFVDGFESGDASAWSACMPACP